MRSHSIFIFLSLAFLLTQCYAQNSPNNLPQVQNEAFNQELKRLLSFSVPLVGVDELATIQKKAVLLDARAEEEYQTAHIPGARFVGYEQLQLDEVFKLPKDTTIVVYCSVGYRSERVAEKLKAAGFQKVYNLYGGIFEWANKGFPLEDAAKRPTNQLHTYNKRWSKWVENPQIKKQW